MAVISDPKHSRPIDVHRWSDHPEVKALVEDIWENHLPEAFTGKPGEKKTGPKPKTPSVAAAQLPDCGQRCRDTAPLMIRSAINARL